MTDISNFLPSYDQLELDPRIADYIVASEVIANVLDKKSGEGYENVLIPSRGVIPFYKTALQVINSQNKTINLARHIFPFTCDSFETDGRAESLREYWVETYNDFINFKTTEKTTFFKFMLDLNGFEFDVPSKAENFIVGSNYIDDYLDYPKGNKTIFIDTVISGRASSTILDAFDKNGMDVFSILLLDKNGDSLKSKYRSTLDAYVGQGKAQYVPVNDLFTEDQGPSFLGSTSLVFPGIVEEAKRVLGYYPGAGVCLSVPRYKKPLLAPNKPGFPVSPNKLYDVGGMLSSSFLLAVLGYTEWLNKDPELYTDPRFDLCNSKLQFEQFFKAVREYDLQSSEATLQAFNPHLSEFGVKGLEASVSSSHVISIHFPDKVTKEMVRRFESNYL